MARNVYLKIAYDGTDFHGWQRQPGVRTVQSVMEDALQRVVRHPVDLVGSGRTDAGVHAVGHVDSFRTSRNLDSSQLRGALESRLPDDLAILDVRDVHPEFHATKSALSKLYRYRLHRAATRPVVSFSQRYAYHCWLKLDVNRMVEGAKYFVGRHDFSSMTPIGTKRTTMVRRVLKCDVSRMQDEVLVDVEGVGFLYNQVRTMVGTLIEVGRGRWEPSHVAEILAGKDRSKAGPTAPAHGLCLRWVRYPTELMVPSPSS